jgi:hypothetical protein
MVEYEPFNIVKKTIRIKSKAPKKIPYTRGKS